MNKSRIQVSKLRLGISLVETIVSTLLVTILMATSMGTFAHVNQLSGHQIRNQKATQFAQYYLSEISAKPFVCPDCGSESIGRGMAEGSIRSNWNDCDDYHGLYLPNLTDERGNSIPEASGWKLLIKVQFANPSDPTQAIYNKTDLKLITLKFWAPDSQVFYFYGLRSRFGAQQSPLDSNYLHGVDILLQSDSSSRLLRSRLVNQLEK